MPSIADIASLLQVPPPAGADRIEIQVDDYVLRVTIAPDADHVAVVSKVGDGARIDVFDAHTGQRTQTISRFPYQWAWTRDSRYLIIADPPELVAWRVNDGAVVKLPFTPTALYGLAITG